MGEDLSLDGREAIRTPMQWDDDAERRLQHGGAGGALSAGRHERSVRRQEGQRTRAATGSRIRCCAGSRT